MAVVKDAAFYRKQRERDKAAAAKGDSKAKKELAQIEAKRRGKGAPTKTYTVDGKTVRAVSRAAALKQGGKSTDNKPQSAMSQVGRAIATSTPGGKIIGAIRKAQQAGEARQGQQAAGIRGAIGKVLTDKGPYSTTAGTTGTYNPQPKPQPKKSGNGSIGTYSGPKPRAYSSLSPADKAKEDRQNERDMAAKKTGNGK